MLLLTTLIVLLFSFHWVHSLLGDKCNIYDIRMEFCGEFEICDEITNSCLCAPGYDKVDDYCLEKKVKFSNDNNISSTNAETTGNSGSSAALSIFLFLFAGINVVIVVYAMQKYKIIHLIRNKMNSYRRSNYDEFMIGQDVDDDPPLR